MPKKTQYLTIFTFLLWHSTNSACVATFEIRFPVHKTFNLWQKGIIVFQKLLCRRWTQTTMYCIDVNHLYIMDNTQIPETICAYSLKEVIVLSVFHTTGKTLNVIYIHPIHPYWVINSLFRDFSCRTCTNVKAKCMIKGRTS